MPTEYLVMYDAAPPRPFEWPQLEETCSQSWEDPKTKPRREVEASTYPGLNSEIRRARRNILSQRVLKDPDSIGYSEETLKRAVDFLTEHLLTIWSRQCVMVPVPRFGIGPNESVDLYWKQPSWELLINIPADPAALASFYGDDYGSQRIKGSFEPREFNLGIATWLMN